MKLLDVGETIGQGQGSYWWENWTNKRQGGNAPAKPNAVLSCYIMDGVVYSLEKKTESGWAGGRCDWTAYQVTNKKLRDYVLSCGEIVWCDEMGRYVTVPGSEQ